MRRNATELLMTKFIQVGKYEKLIFECRAAEARLHPSATWWLKHRNGEYF
jgi:hypothetical protein